jgi:hypothetical protein
MTVTEAIEKLRETKHEVSATLSSAEYRMLLEELLADAEGWRMELEEME